MPSETLGDKIRKGYEAMIDDPDTPPHLRLGALNKLSAHLAAEQGAAPVETRDDQAPDPMMDLDEMEVARRKRARR